MIEVEIKSRITDHKKALEEINKLGGTYSHSEKQFDIYFNAPDKDYKETDEALRIREIPSEDNETERILTYKGPKLNSESKTRKEVEVKIDNTDNMVEILNNLGFKASAIVTKTRRIFNYDDYTITIDKLEELGYFMEIEKVIDDMDDVESIINDILDLFNKMDFEKDFERRSYLELLELKKEKNS